MGFSRVARVVLDCNLSDRKSLDLEQSGKEPVHAFEELEVVGTFPTEGAEAASGVSHCLLRKGVAHRIGNPRGNSANQIVALTAAFDACAADTIELFKSLKELWNVTGVVLKVGIQGYNDRRLGST